MLPEKAAERAAELQDAVMHHRRHATTGEAETKKQKKENNKERKKEGKGEIVLEAIGFGCREGGVEDAVVRSSSVLGENDVSDDDKDDENTLPYAAPFGNCIFFFWVIFFL